MPDFGAGIDSSKRRWRTKQSPPPAPDQQPRLQQSAPAPPLPAPQKILDLGSYTANCERPKDHDEADLCEQRRQAQAAEDAVWWTRFQTCLGILGMAGVVGTLIYAHATLRHSSLTARRQLRAYIDADAPRFEALAPESITVKIHNGGQTPAYRVRSHLNWYRTNAGEPIAAEYAFPDHLSIDPTTSVGTVHQGKERMFSFKFNAGEIERVKAGETDLYFYGHIDYEDVFGETHVTRFFYRYFPAMKDGTHAGHGLLMQDSRNDAT